MVFKTQKSKKSFFKIILCFQMRYYAPKDQIDQVDYAMKIGSKVLPYFEKYYNVTYPLPKAGMFKNIKNVLTTFKLIHTNVICWKFNAGR